LRMLPMNDSVVGTAPLPAGDALAAELVLAASSLTHLCELKLFGFASQLQLLPSVAKVELLPDLHCGICCRRAAYPLALEQDPLLPFKQLAQQCPRLTIEEKV